MKKKLVFGATIGLCLENQNGIMKKVFAQAAAFEEEFDVYMWGFCDGYVVYVHGGEMVKIAPFSSKPERRRVYFSNITRFAKEIGADAFYFRYVTTDFYLLKTLSEFKKCGMVSVIEIPTYPYAGEFRDTLKKRLIYFLDILLREKLKKYVSRIVIFTENPKSIYGIECINTMNGVDFASIPQVNAKFDDGVNMIAVASMLPHHGFDRIIEGIKDYYLKEQEEKVTLSVVGGGPELEKYKALCQSYNLCEYIHFYGQKSGNELDELFEKANIAVGSLGLHRIGLKESSTLKSREYAARGLPIVYSTYDVFLKDVFYAKMLPADESAADVSQIVKFCKEIYSQENVNCKIRDAAYSVCDMKTVMRGAVEYFISKTGKER